MFCAVEIFQQICDEETAKNAAVPQIRSQKNDAHTEQKFFRHKITYPIQIYSYQINDQKEKKNKKNKTVKAHIICR